MRGRWSVAGPLVAVFVAVAVTAVLRAGDDGPGGGSEEPPPPDPVAVTSDGPRYQRLEDLAAASDLVVRAHVVATEPGRTFGEPGGATIRSRLVTLVVDEVLRGDPPSTSSLLVEEEGWLEDGAPLVVDGQQGSAVGDDGVWFLVATDDPDLPTFVTVGAQGRYLVGPDGRSLEGAAVDDPLIAELTALGAEGLTTHLREPAAGT